ncbi:MAG TPA: GNAT family protein [Pyrinomonadaceae bacterium]|jgi:RimJ/RimL family protein N-acetyltransferase|nr:GNAT family protein [Pyrinomonadaceae bacterium]
MNIRGKRIILRAIEVEDLPLLHAWLNRPEIAGGLGDVHFPSSRSQQLKWFERIQADEHTIRLAVQDGERSLIGYTGFWNIHWRDRRAEHALVVGEDARQGQGFGREIIMTCARYAFEEMGLSRLDANILETNQASRKAYEACGYRVEGTLRAHALRGGQRVDRILLGLLAKEYFALVEANRYWQDAADESEQEGGVAG